MTADPAATPGAYRPFDRTVRGMNRRVRNPSIPLMRASMAPGRCLCPPSGRPGGWRLPSGGPVAMTWAMPLRPRCAARAYFGTSSLLRAARSGVLLGFGLWAASGCRPASSVPTSVTGPPPVGGSSGGGGQPTSGCGGAWQGATRVFGAPRVLSGDGASSIVATLFLPSGLTEALILEPGKPDLVLDRIDAAAAAVPVDRAALPVDPKSPIAVRTPLDESAAAIFYGPGGLSASFVDGGGVPHGPFDLSAAGLVSVSASVALEGGAGVVILGTSSAGPVWTTLGASGVGALAPFALGITPDATQSAPLLWDDGTGALTALLPVSYAGKTQLALFGAQGRGNPFAFGPPLRLDTVAPGAVTGWTLALGPSGEAGVLTTQGNQADPQLVGFRLTSSGAAGGIVPDSLAGAIGLGPPPAGLLPWTAGCRAGAGCDPALRFDSSGDLIAVWTQDGSLGIARLPAGATSWGQPAIVQAGPLASNLAVDPAGDVAALVQSPAGLALLQAPASGSPTFAPLAPIPGDFVPEGFAAPTAAGGGAIFGRAPSQPSQIFDWSFPPSGGPTAGSGALLGGGEQAEGLTLAAPTLAVSDGPNFFGAAVAGWTAIAAAGSTAAPFRADLLLAPYDPTAASIGTPVDVAVPGWEQTGTTEQAFAVDPQGDALLVFSQPQGGAPPVYAEFAAAGATPKTACLALPAPSSAPGALRVAVDQIPFGPKALTGSGRIVLGTDAPATAALAR